MTSRIDAATLGRFPVFASVKLETLAQLASHASTQRWSAGQVMFQRGDSGDSLFAITAGQVRLSLMAPNGRELVLKVLGQGDVVGEFAVIDGDPRSTDAMALSAVTAMVISRERFLQVAEARPDLPLAFARYLCSLLRATNFQMESIALYDLQNRLIRFFLLAVQQAYGDAPPAMSRIELGMNQTDLAAVLGASRPRLNNALQELIGAGVIHREGNSLICDLVQLRARAEAGEAGMAV